MQQGEGVVRGALHPRFNSLDLCQIDLHLPGRRVPELLRSIGLLNSVSSINYLYTLTCINAAQQSTQESRNYLADLHVDHRPSTMFAMSPSSCSSLC